MKLKSLLASTLSLSLSLSSLFTSCSSAPSGADAGIEAKVEETLSKMTLEEKIGQMLQLNVDMFMTKPDENGHQHINHEVLDTVISKYKVGSILNAPGPRAATLDEWHEWIGEIQEVSMKELNIPCLYGLDNNHGVTYIQGGTMFPQPINLAASFNTEIAEEGARINAYETRAAGCPWVFNPTVDLGRDPRWSRIWESFGEDAIVNARFGEAVIRGYQSPLTPEGGSLADSSKNSSTKPDGRPLRGTGGYVGVGACIKHYFAYGAPWSGKDRTPAYLAPNMIKEKYFEPFKCGLKAGALSLMVNSASINGVPVHASYEYLTKWAKEDLNWDGMIITDWADIDNLWTREHVAKDKKDAIRIAINAGIDMSMDPYSVDFCILLKELVDEGSVKMERIDDAVRRILRLKYRLGLFDEPLISENIKSQYKNFASKESAEKALHAAEEGIVLLKNESPLQLPQGGGSCLLPIKAGTKILVCGPNSNQMRCLNGGWTYTWQGSKAEYMAEQYNTIYEALCNKYGAENVKLEKGVAYDEEGNYWDEDASGIDRAVAAARSADVIVACIGENSYCETPGNLTDLTLSENQRNLVKALAKTGKPILLVINGGRPRLLADIEPLATAVVDVLLPGNYGGDALANLLSGDVNFSAKMPYTYPKEINSLGTYDYKVSEQVGTMEGAYDYNAKIVQQWGFGFGLSYTTYEYSNLTVDKTQFTASDVLTVTVDVKNTGSVAGKESVLLFSSDLVASIVPDSRRLRAFQKIALNPGEKKTVTFSLPATDLSFVGADGEWTLEDGDFRLMIADQTVTVTKQ